MKLNILYQFYLEMFDCTYSCTIIVLFSQMNVVFQLLQAKQRTADRLAQQGKVKYEYDSDEEVEGGTWEHRR